MLVHPPIANHRVLASLPSLPSLAILVADMTGTTSRLSPSLGCICVQHNGNTYITLIYRSVSFEI